MEENLKSMLSIPLNKMVCPDHPDMTEVDRKITAAALELFAEKGYSGATTLAIAKRACVSEKTLFQHFGTKEQLFIKTVYPSLMKLIQPFLLNNADSEPQPQQNAEGMSLQDRIQTIVKNRLEFSQSHPEIVKFLIQELFLRSTYREAVTDLWMDQIAPLIGEFFEEYKASGEVRDLPVATMMRVIVPVFAGYSIIRSLLAPEGDWNDDEEIGMMMDILLNGLRPR